MSYSLTPLFCEVRSEAHLRRLHRCPEVYVRVINAKMSGNGFCFIKSEDSAGMTNSRTMSDGYKVDGNCLKVRVAKMKRQPKDGDKICFNFEKGSFHLGDSCKFLHQVVESNKGQQSVVRIVPRR